MKQMYFISGMPRAGSTILANILNQNPEIYATQTSGLADVAISLRNTWDNLIEHKSMDRELALKRKRQVIKGLLTNYYDDVVKPIVFDKSRNWLAHIELLEWVMEKPVKVIVPVRPITEVLASYELLWRKTSVTRQMPQEKGNYLKTQSVLGRCKLLMDQEQPVGLAYRRIHDAKQRGFSDRMFLLDFDLLTSNPKDTLTKVYDFLHIKHFKHDFTHVEQVTKENDDVIGIPGLHDIRPTVSVIKPRALEVLGPEVTEIFSKFNLR